ncbi:unnamed protein product [Camellia sinensis]
MRGRSCGSDRHKIYCFECEVDDCLVGIHQTLENLGRRNVFLELAEIRCGALFGRKALSFCVSLLEASQVSDFTGLLLPDGDLGVLNKPGM